MYLKFDNKQWKVEHKNERVKQQVVLCGGMWSLTYKTACVII